MVLEVNLASPNPVFRALADPTRRAIFEELTRQGEQTVHALTRYAGVSQPAVSKHLTVLKAPAGWARDTLSRAARCSDAGGELVGQLWRILARTLCAT